MRTRDSVSDALAIQPFVMTRAFSGPLVLQSSGASPWMWRATSRSLTLEDKSCLAEYGQPSDSDSKSETIGKVTGFLFRLRFSRCRHLCLVCGVPRYATDASLLRPEVSWETLHPERCRRLARGRDRSCVWRPAKWHATADREVN